MIRKTFVEELQCAKTNNYALGAFNIFNHLSAHAVIQAASHFSCPVILQTSVSTVKAFGPASLAVLLNQLKNNAPVNVLTHLDHCQDVDLAKVCVDHGWDAVMYDGSHLPIDENIANCREVVEYAHRKNVFVEGELGRITGVEEEIAVDDDAGLNVTVEDAMYFVEKSGIDVFAPAVGTAHGLYRGAPKIDFDLFQQLASSLDVPLVIHGGTGLSAGVFASLIEKGAAKINVSTALKHAYVNGFKAYLHSFPDQVNPLTMDRLMSEHIQDTISEHLKIFLQDWSFT